jgi:hypothetical protein
MSEVRVTSYCDCPFSTAMEFAQLSLKERGRMQVSPVSAVTENVSHATKLVDDGTDGTRTHDALLLAWKPDHNTTLPDFRGVLTVRPKDRGVSMRLQGNYDPPFGLPGKIFDALAGNRIASRTMQRLLNRVIQDVEAKWSAARRNGA